MLVLDYLKIRVLDSQLNNIAYIAGNFLIKLNLYIKHPVDRVLLSYSQQYWGFFNIGHFGGK